MDQDLNVKAETLEVSEENKGSSRQDVSVGKDFLNKIPFALVLKPTDGKGNLIKLKASTQVKKQLSEEKVHSVGENLCQLYIRQKVNT